jgi:hypothetical protein
MTARQLFAVLLMTIGTVWSLIAFAVLINHFVDQLYLPHTGTYPYETAGMVGSGINLVCGLILFFSANRISRLVGRD